MFSVPISVKNKKEMIDMFETLAHFPDTVMMLRNGDNTVDAHSLMGFFAIDEKIPIELLLESEPDDNLKQAISKYRSGLVSAWNSAREALSIKKPFKIR